MALVAAVGDAVEVVLMIVGGKKSGEVVIEPPGDSGRGRVLEVDDGVLVAGELALVEERAGTVDEAVIVVRSVGINALAMEARKQRG